MIAGGGLTAVSAQQRPTLDLIEMSLEELLSLEITSAGKKEQLIGDTAAASIRGFTQENATICRHSNPTIPSKPTFQLRAS